MCLFCGPLNYHVLFKINHNKCTSSWSQGALITSESSADLSYSLWTPSALVKTHHKCNLHFEKWFLFIPRLQNKALSEIKTRRVTTILDKTMYRDVNLECIFHRINCYAKERLGLLEIFFLNNFYVCRAIHQIRITFPLDVCPFFRDASSAPVHQ